MEGRTRSEFKKQGSQPMNLYKTSKHCSSKALNHWTLVVIIMLWDQQVNPWGSIPDYAGWLMTISTDWQERDGGR
ncbi:unnamed protein product, partial [Notodromas monacha]